MFQRFLRKVSQVVSYIICENIREYCIDHAYKVDIYQLIA